MDGSWPGGCQADPGVAGELGVRASHEGRHLLVAHLHEPRVLAAELLESGHDPVDAVAGIAEHAVHVPGTEPLHQVLANRSLDLFHDRGRIGVGFIRILC